MNARYSPFHFIFQSGPCLSACVCLLTPIRMSHTWAVWGRRPSHVSSLSVSSHVSSLSVSLGGYQQTLAMSEGWVSWHEAFKWWDLRDVGVRSHGPSVHRRYWFLCFVTGPRPGQLITDSPTHSMRYCIQANQNCLGWKMLPIAGILCNLHICCSTTCRWPQDFCSHIFHSMTHSPGSG